MMVWMRGDAFGDDGVDDGDRQVVDSSVRSRKDTVSDGILDRGL